MLADTDRAVFCSYFCNSFALEISAIFVVSVIVICISDYGKTNVYIYTWLSKLKFIFQLD